MSVQMKVVTAEEVRLQIDALRGPQGEKGETGAQGERGERGPQGVQGPKGDTGARGETGERGAKGERGDTGPQGLPGRDGRDGRDGAAGPKGDKGDPGERGPQGEPGIPGKDGVDGTQGFSPSVNLERVSGGVLITVENKDGDKIATVYDGETGPQGEQGVGIANAVLNEDYTLTLTMTDGTSHTTPSIRGEVGPGLTITGFGQKPGPNESVIAFISFSDGTEWKITLFNGEKGEKGDKGDPGDAVPTVRGTTETITPSQVIEAINSGQNVQISCQTNEFGVLTFTSFTAIMNGAMIIASESATMYMEAQDRDMTAFTALAGAVDTGVWTHYITPLATFNDFLMIGQDLDRHDQEIVGLRTDVTGLRTDVNALNEDKVNFPKSDGAINYGTAGQFAVSDGAGGIAWKTIAQAEEVSF